MFPTLAVLVTSLHPKRFTVMIASQEGAGRNSPSTPGALHGNGLARLWRFCSRATGPSRIYCTTVPNLGHKASVDILHSRVRQPVSSQVALPSVQKHSPRPSHHLMTMGKFSLFRHPNRMARRARVVGTCRASNAILQPSARRPSSLSGAEPQVTAANRSLTLSRRPHLRRMS